MKMSKKQAGCMSLVRRLAGWVLFIPSLISTVISLMKYIDHSSLVNNSANNDALKGVIMDFAHAIIGILQANTPFLHFFWQYSPLPDFQQQTNLAFWIIYLLIFVAMALHSSGTHLRHRLRLLREQLEAQVIIEQAKGDQGVSRQQLEKNLLVPDTSLFCQYVTLYILPIIFIVAGYFMLSLLQL